MKASETKSTTIDNKSTTESDSDVEFVNETVVTKEEEEEAKRLLLPPKFFAYRQLPDCKCDQCKKDDEYFNETKEDSQSFGTPNASILDLSLNTSKTPAAVSFIKDTPPQDSKKPEDDKSKVEEDKTKVGDDKNKVEDDKTSASFKTFSFSTGLSKSGSSSGSSIFSMPSTLGKLLFELQNKLKKRDVIFSRKFVLFWSKCDLHIRE